MVKVAPVGEWVSEEPKGARGAWLHRELAAVRGADGDGSDLLMEQGSGRRIITSGRQFLSRRYGQKAEEYAALLSKVSTNSSKRAKLISVQGVLFSFTFIMSTFETGNRTMIIIVMASFGGTVGLAAHLVLGEAGLACYGAFLIVAGALTYHAVRGLEEVEVVKKKYEAAFRECTKGIEPGSDQLGPMQMLNPDLMQDGNHDVDHYIEEAKRLLEPFREEVLSVLAKAANPTGGEDVTVLSNTKG
eukprot:CAMPEP_0182591498 /NCGR_PEP_ID=MMETSP1324-20130603/73947_1 /TAXON_ID=236786 /ORGANISM="Florenciella sp., Strain RCC1587" /LENGTH=244 /DNA_ID=CAMNT_0024808805 /DNA_START=37 /DNA_END=767 /DNA_ORIENTATION=+